MKSLICPMKDGKDIEILLDHTGDELREMREEWQERVAGVLRGLRIKLNSHIRKAKQIAKDWKQKDFESILPTHRLHREWTSTLILTTRVSEGCHDCVFWRYAHEVSGDYDPACRALMDCEMDWDGKQCDNNEKEYRLRVPDWCPLRKGPVTVRLKGKEG
jgi:hypothetical protein